MKIESKEKSLSKKEVDAQKIFISGFKIKKRKTKRPIIIAMIGLVGSGKSSAAKKLAPLLGATVVEADGVRIALRKKGLSYDPVRAIINKATLSVIKQGGNVVIDSDLVDPEKRAHLEKEAIRAGIKIVYLRTFCNRDVAIGRLIIAKYFSQKFFGAASSPWKGQYRAVVVGLREMWRRTPHHYKWINKDGGKWILKKFKFPIFANIDTTTSDWKKNLNEYAKKLLKM